ncbi:MAG: aminomethyl-transferring glycine dehydrogenase subunit GcvPB [Thermoplasmata archaeon]|nr:MAG: aminomethyl-transferring glycine dehydrogenase subunit GcvPB [Thermoplasmata archaeon]
MKLIFEKSVSGRMGVTLPKPGVPKSDLNIPEEYLREDLNLPELSEIDVVRHYTSLSLKNFGVDSGFYPLGSCTMKYNPKINESIASFPGFRNSHPYQPEGGSQGALQLMYKLSNYLCEITGMDAFTLQPAAGAHGELTGLMMAKAYLKKKGEERKNILIPDSAHGTNPASSVGCGFDTIKIETNRKGTVDLEALAAAADENTAVLMITNPNTLGIFEKDIVNISKIVHSHGGLVYLDGANMNAMLGIVKPRDMGVDMMHLNLHKTFSTPHGGGGPGGGPVGVREFLKDFLPAPIIEKKKDKYILNYDVTNSIGRVKPFYGNFGVMVKAFTYIRMLGSQGLKDVAENAVLNANYLMRKLKEDYLLPYDVVCKHEFVISGENQKKDGVSTMDIAKRLLDYGFHPPTIYFPLIVKEAMMIEPTETESKQTLDEFADAMHKIAEEAKTNPDIVKSAPHITPTRRLDGVLAARKPIVKYKPSDSDV